MKEERQDGELPDFVNANMREKKTGKVSTSVIIQNFKESIDNYDSRNSWWRDGIREYDIFMGDIRPYWLNSTNYSYQKLLRSEEFIEEVRRVLKAWGMDSRGSILSSGGLFLDTMAEVVQDFDLLARTKVRLETLNLKEKIEGEMVATIIGRIYDIFSQTGRLSVSGGMVVASKTAHMLMPELFVIIDRRIMKRLHEVSDYCPHPSDGESWYDIISDYSGRKLNPFSGYAWDSDECYLAALMYYKRIVLEWCQQNNADVMDFLKLGVRTVTTDIVFDNRIRVRTATARIVDMALW